MAADTPDVVPVSSGAVLAANVSMFSNALAMAMRLKSQWLASRPTWWQFFSGVYDLGHTAVITASSLVGVSGADKKALVLSVVNDLISWGFVALPLPGWMVWAQRAIGAYNLWARARQIPPVNSDPQAFTKQVFDGLVERIYANSVKPNADTVVAQNP